VVNMSRIMRETGLSWRSLMAILLASTIFLPVHIFLRLATPMSVSWSPVILLLFVELARFFHAPLTKEEAFIIYFVCAVAVGESIIVGYTVPFLGFPYRVYLVQSPYFMVLGFHKHVPWWFLPPLTSEAIKYRTLLHPDWAFYIGIVVLSELITLGMIVPMSFILAQLYIEVEELPFPIAQVQRDLILSLVEREPERRRIFILSVVIGIIYSAVLYGTPIITMALFGKPFSVTGSIVWSFFDLTGIIQPRLPGAIIGISFDLLSMTGAWVVPPYMIISALIASITIFVIGNHVALIIPWEGFEMWRRDYFPGAELIWLYQRSIFDIWMNISIGLAIVTGVLPMILEYKSYATAFRNLARLPERFKAAGYPSLLPLLVAYSAAVLSSLAIFMYFVPAFPIILLLPFVAWGFIWPFISAWSFGTIGITPPQPPLLREATIIFSGYKGLDVWFAGWVAQPGNGPGILVNIYRVARWLGVNPRAYLKAIAVAIPALYIMSLLYVDMFWRLAPMPSVMYPWTEVTWPINALNWTIWPSMAVKGYFPTLRLELVEYAMIFSIILAVVLKLLKLPLSILVGLLWGVGSLPHGLFGLLIGSAFGKLLERKLGKERWRSVRTVIIAGLMLGNAITISLGAAVLLIVKALWALPY